MLECGALLGFLALAYDLGICHTLQFGLLLQLQLLPLPSGVLIITLTLTTGLGPFSLVLSVSNATVAILSSGVT